MDFTAFNESSRSIRLKWNNDLPVPVDDSKQRGVKIDYRQAEHTEERSILLPECGEHASYLFSNLTIFTNYCFIVVAFHNSEIVTKLDNRKCVHTAEEGK